MNRSRGISSTRGSLVGWLALLVAAAALIVAVVAVQRSGVNVEEAVRNQVEESTAALRDEVAALERGVGEGAERAQEAVTEAAQDAAAATQEGAERFGEAVEGAQRRADAAADETPADGSQLADTEENQLRAQETTREAEAVAPTAELEAAWRAAAEQLSGIDRATITTRQGREEARETVESVRQDLSAAHQDAGAEAAWNELEPQFDDVSRALESEPETALDRLEELVARLEQGAQTR